MATALRFSNAALRPALSSVYSPARSIAFTGLRCYSSAKSQVSFLQLVDLLVQSVLKILSLSKNLLLQSSQKRLRRSRSSGRATATRLLEKSLSIKSMEELVGSSHLSGKDLFSTPKKAFGSVARPYQNAASCCPRLLEALSLCRKVR